MASSNQNPFSSLIEIMREQGSFNNSPDLMIGEILNSPPNIAIKVGDIQLDKDNLYIADYLLEDYKRKIQIKEESLISHSGGSVTGKTNSASVSEHGSHSHNVNSLSDCAITVSCNRFVEKSTKYIIAEHPEFIDVKDNYITDEYKIKFLKLKEFDNHSGYNRSYLGNSLSLFVYENNYRRKQVTPNKILKVKNIPQYITNGNDLALKTGCEATACAILLSYILNKNITKNEMASYMKMGEPGKDSFWDSFIGDIYNDGWGCMSSVSVNALNNYLKANNLQDMYYVINTTNMPLYELLSFVSSGIPVIVWCTMGNKGHMYHKKHGSTIWDINGKKLYWPGNDHSLVIVGYSFTYGKIYLADPEENSERIIDSDIYEFENRFTELYSQSILVLKKRATR